MKLNQPTLFVLLSAALPFLGYAAAGQPQAGTGTQSTLAQKQPVTVAVDASAFFDDIPGQDTLIDEVGGRGGGGGGQGGARGAAPGATDTSGRGGGGAGASAAASNLPSAASLFNNEGIVLNARTSLMCVREIPEAGTYHLFVRSQGSRRSSFRVSVNSKMTTVDFGNTETLTLQPGGTFDLKKGPARIMVTRINEGSTFDALLLTKRPELKEEDLPALQFGEDTVLLKEYNVNGTVKFGDVDGDGKADLLVIGAGGTATVYNHDGKKLWSWEPTGDGPRLGGGFEPPGLVWDLDHKGRADVIHWRMIDGKEKLVVADGLTGEIKHSTDWPTPPLPHTYYNFRLAVANLDGGYPNCIVVLTDPGDDYKSIAAYSADLTKRWEHIEHLKKDHLGHYPYPVDVNGDGKDEVFVSALALDSKGNKLWDRFDMFYDNHDHCDSLHFADLNGDGRLELICNLSDIGLVVSEPMTGKILWQHPAGHSQQAEVGKFLAGYPGQQIVVGARYYDGITSGALSAQCHWFDNRGNLIRKWPSRPLYGNPNFVKGDWRGDGTTVLFWHKFKMNADGTGELYFPDTVYQMFDFDGSGHDDVITHGGGGIRVYACKTAKPNPKRVVKDPNVLRWKVANQTEYK